MFNKDLNFLSEVCGRYTEWAKIVKIANESCERPK